MDNLSCPYCASPSVRLLEATFTVRLVERSEGGGFVERKCPYYRCLDCGRTFDEVEGEESSEFVEDGGPSFD
jgi:DNA-directed RNA polymerase subunit RPC12/RpoP